MEKMRIFRNRHFTGKYAKKTGKKSIGYLVGKYAFLGSFSLLFEIVSKFDELTNTTASDRSIFTDFSYFTIFGKKERSRITS